MRVAIVSDIHGNKTAFEAVLRDLQDTSPDLILHGGDLADTGASPCEIVDRIRSLGWQGVAGNTDHMLALPETFEAFAKQAPQLQSLWEALREMAAVTRETLGEERLAWLRGLPHTHIHSPVALVHASPESLWRASAPEASDDELQATYGHIHRPYMRILSGLIVANTGSVGLPYDGDRRASYLLVDGSNPEIRRVEYDVNIKVQALAKGGLPHVGWVAKALESASPQMP